jgi:3-deoxy-D-manno-octulosonic-acid transferase
VNNTKPALALSLRLLIWASAALELLAPMILRRRLRRGKEHPTRWREKLGIASASRPSGPLIWLHAVGVGEVMALRGLITLLQQQRPDLHFLVTSTALTSATAWNANPINGVIHQFLPLDLPRSSRRFLDHWSPDLVIWAEQDLWPALVSRISARHIPQAMVNARLNDTAYAKRTKLAWVYADALSRLTLIDAQDDTTAKNLSRLGALNVTVSGSLKPVSPPLSDWPEDRAAVTEALGGRQLWLCAPSHPKDEAIALAAQAMMDNTLLVIAPRLPNRGAEIREAVLAHGLSTALWSNSDGIERSDVLIADSFGQMGLWYRMADFVLIGGTFCEIEGHNPWEAIALDCAVLHGPRTANFAADYKALDSANGARRISSAQEITRLHQNDLRAISSSAKVLANAELTKKAALAQQLLGLIGGQNA